MFFCCNNNFNFIDWMKDIFYKIFNPVVNTDEDDGQTLDVEVVVDVIDDDTPTTNQPRVRMYNNVVIRD